MAEELDRCLGLEPALDALISKRWNTKGELGFGDARLNAERLGDDVAWPT
jgi:hypothetical protein